MRAVLPGKPRANPQALCTARWSGRQIVAYISGNSLVILDGPETLLQTICQDEVEALDAVAIDTVTGKFATCSGGTVFIFEPYGLEEFTKWSQQCSFAAFDESEAGSCTLSWGMPGELLVGRSRLRLFHIGKSEELLWDNPLPNNARQALFSPDADLIASSAECDPLLKIWRRLAGGAEQNTFDFCYLPHPAPVTDFFWRKPEKRVSQGGQHVLYTVCADSKLRVWAQLDHHSFQILELWGEVDLKDVIQPRHLNAESQSDERRVFVISGDDFDAATKRALKADIDANKIPFLEHLSDIASQKPDICVVLDNKGHMSAWGLQNVGSKRRKESDVFNIALVENFNLFSPTLGIESTPNVHTSITGFLKDSATFDSSYSVLVHYFDGSITWMDGRVDEYFDPAPNSRRLRRQALWTAHEQPIDKMVRNASGLSLISRSEQGEALVWQSPSLRQPTSLHRVSGFDFEGAVLGLCVLDHGNHFVSLQSGKVCLWESEGPTALQIACCQLNATDAPVCVLKIPSITRDSSSRYVAVISSRFEGVVYEVQLPDASSPRQTSNEARPCSISRFCAIENRSEAPYSSISAIDPVGHASAMPLFLDTFAQDVVLACTKDGLVETFAAQLNVAKGSVSWVRTASIDTGLLNPSISAASSSRKVAIVDEPGNGLLVWDTKSGDLEFEQSFGASETIRDLDWTATPDSQSLLAVGFPHKVIIFGQMRYDYLRPEPAWAAIREIYIRDLTPHPIGDSTWLSGGNLVIGAGRQLFIYDDAIKGQDKTVKDIPVATHVTSPGRLFTQVRLLNGPLPLFHPQFLTQAILAGKLALAQRIVVSLHKALKFYTEGDELDMNLGISDGELVGEEETDSTTNGVHAQTPKLNGFSNHPEPETVTEELAAALNEKLVRISLPYMSSQDQFYLSNLVDSVALTEKQRRSVDDNAARFITFFRQFMLIKASEHRFKAGLTWREYSWAFHSNSQDILVDLVSRQYNGRMLWPQAKESGVFMWMTDLTTLRAQFEVVARNEYTKTDERNPVDCSLYYLALKKKNVLLGLWRMAGWNREQAGTQRLLSNNFAEARWKTAALKNAYALLGKRRFEYAAAFFLLADHLQDAVNVCYSQMKDLQLAIAIARVYDGDESPVLRQLLEERVLPEATRSGDRWQASWAFWLLGQRDRAVRALVTPIWTLVDGAMSPTTQAKSFLANDPALLAMYAHFREKSLQALKGATQVSPGEEWEFVLRTARLYARMGCDYLALDLVRNWSFLQMAKLTAIGNRDEVPDPRKLLRRRSSLVVDDMTAPKSPKLSMKTGSAKPPPTMFEEPAASSLLDQFGF